MIQFVWWGDLVRWGFWQYPRKGSHYYEIQNKPMFNGLCLGLFEIRFFLEKPVKNGGVISTSEKGIDKDARF